MFQEESQQKIVCPGRVSALAVSPDGLFCIAGIADKVYIWEVSIFFIIVLMSAVSTYAFYGWTMGVAVKT